jgi:hypothetical protein
MPAIKRKLAHDGRGARDRKPVLEVQRRMRHIDDDLALKIALGERRKGARGATICLGNQDASETVRHFSLQRIGTRFW